MSWPRNAATRVSAKSKQPKFNPYKLPHEQAEVPPRGERKEIEDG